MKIDIEKGDYLTPQQVLDIRSEFSGIEYVNRLKYAQGKNVKILNRVYKDTKAPQEKICVSYARKIINTVVGYMYKPGLITYKSKNESYQEQISELFDYNDEPIKTSHLGKQASIQGVAYELHWVERNGTVIIPRFSKLPANQVIPVYNYAIEPEMIAALWFYEIGDIEKIFVYYPDLITEYEVPLDGRKENEIILVGEERHEYEDVPFVVYQNNEDEIGDFEPVLSKIDAYDILMSDSMNEFARFAWAYLVLKGLKLDEENIEEIKDRRTFEILTEAGGVEFLTKDINADFIKFMSEWIRHEIHRQSHVPDFLEYRSGEPLSGAAMERMLYDFEFIAATKEALFKEGLQRRFTLINNILGKTSVKDLGDDLHMDIVMNRNKPLDLKSEAETMNLYAGHVSEETLLTNFAPFVDNPAEEIEKVNEEQEIDIERQQKLFEGREEEE